VAINSLIAARAEKSNFIQAVADSLRARILSGHYLAKGYPVPLKAGLMIRNPLARPFCLLGLGYPFAESFFESPMSVDWTIYKRKT